MLEIIKKDNKKEDSKKIKLIIVLGGYGTQYNDLRFNRNGKKSILLNIDSRHNSYKAEDKKLIFGNKKYTEYQIPFLIENNKQSDEYNNQRAFLIDFIKHFDCELQLVDSTDITRDEKGLISVNEMMKDLAKTFNVDLLRYVRQNNEGIYYPKPIEQTIPFSSIKR